MLKQKKQINNYTNKKTFFPNPEKVDQSWHFIDAKDRVLGRLASEIAVLLIGKNKAEYSPHLNLGDKVVVTNAKEVCVTGRKLKNKIYHRHTGYPGSVKSESLEHLLKRRPDEVLRRAVKGMLPKNKLRKARMSNLYIYSGADHPHTAQKNAKK